MRSPALGPARKPTRRIMLMKGLRYIGLDVHKKSISYAIKTYAGELVERGLRGPTDNVLVRFSHPVARRKNRQSP